MMVMMMLMILMIQKIHSQRRSWVIRPPRRGPKYMMSSVYVTVEIELTNSWASVCQKGHNGHGHAAFLLAIQIGHHREGKLYLIYQYRHQV